MRVLFCGGGTGGHVYPALTVANALRQEAADAKHDLDLVYVGVRGRMDAELVARENIPFKAVTAGPVRVASLSGTSKGLAKVLAGAAESYRILGSFKPDVVFATGGYGSVGVGLAARMRRLPLLLFLPDVEAGLAVKTLVKIADQIAVTVPAAEAMMPRAKTVLTGYPVRPPFFDAERLTSRARLGLHATMPVLLVTGGSTGARAINRNVMSWASDFLRAGEILHVCGRNDEAQLRVERTRLPPDLQSRYHLHAYLYEDDMAAALVAADLGVMRAGASTLGELPATQLPAVLIPGEFSDQADNARYLETAGAATLLPESRLDDLYHTVTALLADTDRRIRMRTALATLSHPDASYRLARLIMQMAGAPAEVPA